MFGGMETDQRPLLSGMRWAVLVMLLAGSASGERMTLSASSSSPPAKASSDSAANSRLLSRIGAMSVRDFNDYLKSSDASELDLLSRAHDDLGVTPPPSPDEGILSDRDALRLREALKMARWATGQRRAERAMGGDPLNSIDAARIEKAWQLYAYSISKGSRSARVVPTTKGLIEPSSLAGSTMQ